MTGRTAAHKFITDAIRVGLFLALIAINSAGDAADPVDFVRDIQPIFASRCVNCHGETTAKNGLRLDLKSATLAGGDSGVAILPKQSQKSPLVERIRSQGDDRMPPKGEPLTAEQIGLVERWIDQGAVWPDGVDKVVVRDKYDWWSFRPLVPPELPKPTVRLDGTDHTANPIDAFIVAKLMEKGLTPSPQADRRTLARRVYFDVIGLPPTPEEVEAFVQDQDPDAYSRLVDALLESPGYGERWARHWLDVVHYGDTHGYDKDKPRPNAWPYRDYVIRAFNNDKPYSQFVAEQIAGDVLAAGTEDGVTATGFIAAGPWDFIGHAEVPESKIDGKIARNLDRDDMVTNTCNTFVSLTVQCARCHNHKFDPVVQEDYYRLQAVFAALDRADRPYDIDPSIGQHRAVLVARQRELQDNQRRLEARIAELGGPELAEIEKQIAASVKGQKNPLAARFGYHSQVEPSASATKWVQVDLGESQQVDFIQIVGCHDDYNNIGAGFGFPARFKIELSDDETFQSSSRVVVDLTESDFPNPGVKPLKFPAQGKSGRFVRVTATKLAPRQNDFILALAELSAIDAEGKNRASERPVTAYDSVESAPRWQRSNLVDGYYYGIGSATEKSLEELKSQKAELITTRVDEATRAAVDENAKRLAETVAELGKLPSPQMVYAGTIHTGGGSFMGTGASGGKPRTIHVLTRGDVTQPGKVVGPGTAPLGPGLQGEFSIPDDQPEGRRRMELAAWLTAKQNPLTWRSIVNRVWQYHFGKGIVDSPSDFGRMGQLPSHQELLDWLAIEFRDNGQSLKRLHRLILNSATYRQVSSESGSEENSAIDASNTYLWRMNRRKLEAEAVRDAALAIAGKLNHRLYGPAFQDFVVEKPDHSPHYEYRLYDPDDVRTHRRSIYRFLVRSQPQPFMTTLDCADPSMSVEKRNETVTALQALALLNNRLMLTMAKEMAINLQEQKDDLAGQIELAFRLAIARSPSTSELSELKQYAQEHGMVGTCRLLMNLNEFVFVD